MSVSQCFNPELITHKCKIPSESHNEVFYVLYNLVLHNSFVNIFYIPCSKFLYINEVQ